MNGYHAEGAIQRAREVLALYAPELIPQDSLRPAAVLLLLFEKEGEPYLLFIQRAQHVRQHKGQIAFPGGSWEEHDADVVQTALREAHEEVGLHPEQVEVIGRLDDLVTRTNFRISPVVGVLSTGARLVFVPQESEVARVMEVPLGHLMDSRNLKPHILEWQGQLVELPSFDWNGDRIWGATAQILRQFLGLLGYSDDF